MARTKTYKIILRKWLEEYIKMDSKKLVPIQHHLVINEAKTEFVLIAMGWLKKRYLHHIVFHLQLTDDYIWIHQNNTDVDLETELSHLKIPVEFFRVSYLEKADKIKTPVAA